MEKPEENIERIFKEDGRYPIEAVEFVRQGLSFTVEKLSQGGRISKAVGEHSRHISGEQLCWGLRALAQNRWGFMARAVLEYWNITGTGDFGEIVFLLVNNNWMRKQPQDSIEDFDGVYDFHEVFESRFEIKLKSQPDSDCA